MGDTFAISALIRKRARIAGEIEAAKHVITQRKEQLAQIDAVIGMFKPDCNPDMIPPIRPAKRGLYFSYGQLPRLCMSVLRGGNGPVRFDVIVDRIVEAKGFTMEGHLKRHITDVIRAALIRMEGRGKVRRVIREPEVWWELAR
jgi:hypothetical protein